MMSTARSNTVFHWIFCLGLMVCHVASGVEGEWVRNTFPGPGHKANEGPWGPGQGSDRTEYLSFFQVHPANPHFMLQGTDLGRLVYTNTRLGGTEFVAAEVPVRHTGTCAFDPHDGQTAYVLFMEHFVDGKSGWWKTVDEGESWYQVLDTSGERALYNLLVVNPDAARKDEVYVGTRGNGLLRSVDGGETFGGWLLPGAFVYHMDVDASGDTLFVITLNFDESGKVERQDLYAVELVGGALNLLEGFELGTPVGLSSNFDFPLRFLDTHPGTRGAGLLIEGNKLYDYTFTEAGVWSRVEKSSPDMPGSLQIARYNPANPLHIVATGIHGTGFTGNFQWSTDGGSSWSEWAVNLGTTTAFTDYGPHNHHAAPNYHYPQNWMPNSIRNALYFDFLPGDHDSLVMWDFGWYKGPMRSDDYGANFSLFAHGGNFKNGSQIAIGSTDAVVAISHLESGVTLTNDGGESWRSYHTYNTAAFPQNLGSPTWRYRSTWGVAIHPTNDNVILVTAGWEPVRILRTEDFGTTWTEVGQIDSSTVADFGDESLNVSWDRQNPDRVFVHYFRNENGGTSFTDGLGTLTEGNTLLAHAVTTVSSSNADLVLSKEGGRDWYLSLNAGDSWDQLPVPPNATDGATTAVTPNRHAGVEIDPNPLRDPTLDPVRRVRLLNGGQGGVWAYTATSADQASGVWALLDGIVPNAQPHVSETWLLGAAVDPRPGYEDTLYGVPGYCGATTRVDLGYRQVYRSLDGGSTWHDLYAGGKQGELPDYVSIGPYVVSPNTGALYLFDPTGLYRYAEGASRRFRVAVNGGDGDALVAPGTVVTLQAQPPASQCFSHWAGDWRLLDNPLDPAASLTLGTAHAEVHAVYRDTGAVPSFADWFSSEWPGADPAQRGWLDDPDYDGATNGVEYFFGTSPLSPSPAPAHGLEWVGSGWEIRFRRRSGVAGVVPLVQTGHRLDDWLAAAPDALNVMTDGDFEWIILGFQSNEALMFSRLVLRQD